MKKESQAALAKEGAEGPLEASSRVPPELLEGLETSHVKAAVLAFRAARRGQSPGDWLRGLLGQARVWAWCAEAGLVKDAADDIDRSLARIMWKAPGGMQAALERLRAEAGEQLLPRLRRAAGEDRDWEGFLEAFRA